MYSSLAGKLGSPTPTHIPVTVTCQIRQIIYNSITSTHNPVTDTCQIRQIIHNSIASYFHIYIIFVQWKMLVWTRQALCLILSCRLPFTVQHPQYTVRSVRSWRRVNRQTFSDAVRSSALMNPEPDWAVTGCSSYTIQPWRILQIRWLQNVQSGAVSNSPPHGLMQSAD